VLAIATSGTKEIITWCHRACFPYENDNRYQENCLF